MTTALRDLIANPNAAELELVARFGMLPEDARRERVFEAFAKNGLPHRRIEGWQWSDFKAALPVIETPPSITVADTLVTNDALVFTFTPTGFTWPEDLPDGVRVLAKPEAQAFGGAEEMPLGALAAALSGGGNKPGTLMIEATAIFGMEPPWGTQAAPALPAHFQRFRPLAIERGTPMGDNDTLAKPRVKPKTKVERPRLHKVILVNDDYTPRDFVVMVLKAVFRTSEEQAYRVMITAHRKGTCVVAVYTRDIAETKATEATEIGKSAGYPLQFTTEPEE